MLSWMLGLVDIWLRVLGTGIRPERPGNRGPPGLDPQVQVAAPANTKRQDRDVRVVSQVGVRHGGVRLTKLAVTRGNALPAGKYG